MSGKLFVLALLPLAVAAQSPASGVAVQPSARGAAATQSPAPDVTARPPASGVAAQSPAVGVTAPPPAAGATAQSPDVGISAQSTALGVTAPSSGTEDAAQSSAAHVAAQSPAPSVVAHRAAAAASARLGHWRHAEASQRLALDACRPCAPEVRAVLRAELAGFLTLGGFPEAAVALWKQSLAELPAGSPEIPAAHMGLGVALYTAGRREDAKKAWKLACLAAASDLQARAACQFNIAVARMDSEPVWSELEEVLPTLLAAPGAVNRATALLQTSAAALAVGRLDRAALLADQAEAVVAAELDPKHPFLAFVYALRARLADARGDGRQARSWRKKAASIPQTNGWNRQTISVDELKEKPRP